MQVSLLVLVVLLGAANARFNFRRHFGQQQEDNKRNLFGKLTSAVKDVVGGKDIGEAVKGVVQEVGNDKDAQGAVEGLVKGVVKDTDIGGAVKDAITGSDSVNEVINEAEKRILGNLLQQEDNKRNLFGKLTSAVKDVVGGKDIGEAVKGVVQEVGNDKDAQGAVKGLVKDVVKDKDIEGAVKDAITGSDSLKDVIKETEKRIFDNLLLKQEVYKRNLFGSITSAVKDVVGGKDIGEAVKGVVQGVVKGKGAKADVEATVQKVAKDKDFGAAVKGAVAGTDSDKEVNKENDDEFGDFLDGIVKAKETAAAAAENKRAFGIAKRVDADDTPAPAETVNENAATDEVKEVSEEDKDNAEKKKLMIKLYHHLNELQGEVLNVQLYKTADLAKQVMAQLDETCKQIMPLFETQLNLKRRRRRSAGKALLDNIGGGVNWRKLLSVCALHMSNTANTEASNKVFEEVASLERK